MSLEFGRVKLEDRPRAKRHLKRIAGVTRPVAGASRRAHAPEPAPVETLSLGVEANTPTDRELLLERKLKTTFSELVAASVKNEYYRKRHKSNAGQIERRFQAHRKTEYRLEDHCCYPPT